MPSVSFDSYLKSIQKNRQKGSERSHYPALKALLDDPANGIDAVIEEKGNKAGIPDFTVKRRDLLVGYVEAKDVGSDLNSMITNHGYLDNPTFRGMRQSLEKTFDEIYLMDLHGNSKKKEVAPDGSPDKNVFDIQQGVAVAIMVKYPQEKP